MRGEIFRLGANKDATGHEQKGARYCVVVQGDDFEMLTTWLICPTSASAPERKWRPEIEVLGQPTRVLVEQMRAVDTQKLGARVGFLPFADMIRIDQALMLILGLR